MCRCEFFLFLRLYIYLIYIFILFIILLINIQSSLDEGGYKDAAAQECADVSFFFWKLISVSCIRREILHVKLDSNWILPFLDTSIESSWFQSFVNILLFSCSNTLFYFVAFQLRYS